MAVENEPKIKYFIPLSTEKLDDFLKEAKT
jgi:hypothetical protein